MTAATTLLAFRRFVSRRGIPNTVYSDNAQSFHSCARAFKAAASALQEYATGLNVHWKFIVERAPWWGGWWERLIRSTKDVLKRYLGRSSLTAEALSTTLCEVEAVINSRPLTYVEDHPDEGVPLTPSHFLTGRRALCMPQELAVTETSSTPADLQRRACYHQRLTAELWRRWRNAYLLLLRSAHSCPQATSPQLKVGDVVIVHDDNAPPMQWKLGRVTMLHHGVDGVARACSVRTATGHVINRPVQKLYLLESAA